MSEQHHFQITVMLTVPPQTKTDPEDIAGTLERRITYAIENWYEDYGQPRNLAAECPTIHTDNLNP